MKLTVRNLLVCVSNTLTYHCKIAKKSMLQLRLGVNFIKVFMHSFCMSRSQKCKKDSQVKQLFALLRSAHVKAACKNIDEIDPWLPNWGRFRFTADDWSHAEILFLFPVPKRRGLNTTRTHGPGFPPHYDQVHITHVSGCLRFVICLIV